MPGKDSQAVGDATVDQVLGYLNFSSGAADAQFLANLNRLFRQVQSRPELNASEFADVLDQVSHSLDE